MKLFSDLNREQLREEASHGAMVVLPLGATEQHGPHLPSGADTMIVQAVATLAAQRIPEAPLIVAPALALGSSDHHLLFGATLSLRTGTYYRVLHDLIESLVKDGFTRLFLLNGHGGNHELAQLAVRDAAIRHSMRAAAGSYWVMAWDALVAAGVHESCRIPGHAGAFETSLLLALRPELVAARLPHRDAPAASHPRGFLPWREERSGFWRDIDGFTDSPDRAAAQRGEELLEIICAAVAKAFADFYNG